MKNDTVLNISSIPIELLEELDTQQVGIEIGFNHTKTHTRALAKFINFFYIVPIIEFKDEEVHLVSGSEENIEKQTKFNMFKYYLEFMNNSELKDKAIPYYKDA